MLNVASFLIEIHERARAQRERMSNAKVCGYFR